MRTLSLVLGLSSSLIGCVDSRTIGEIAAPEATIGRSDRPHADGSSAGDLKRADAGQPGDVALVPDSTQLAGEGEKCGDDVMIQKKCLPGLVCAVLDGPVTEHAPGVCVKPAQGGETCNTPLSTPQGDTRLPCAQGLACCYPCAKPGCQDQCVVYCTGPDCSSDGCPPSVP